MRGVSEQPDSGQFVAVWKYNGKVWSCVYKYTAAGELLEYNSESDEFFMPASPTLCWMNKYSPEFYVS